MKHYLLFSFGDLAQLARAFDWQSKGQGFDSPNLHILEAVSKVEAAFFVVNKKRQKKPNFLRVRLCY